MKKAAAHPTSNTTSDHASLTVGSITLQLMDTTWRIATPVLILAIAGIFADKQLRTMPWITLLGVVIGFGLAGVLVKRQLDSINKKEQQ